MNQLLKNTIIEYIHTNKFTIQSISEKRSNKNGAFLIKSGKKKFKANIFEDKEELKNFLALAPLIDRAPKILHYNKNIVLTEWLEGKVIEAREISSLDLRKIAELQARIHKIPVKFDKEKVINNFKKKMSFYLYKLRKISNLSNQEIEAIQRKFDKELPKNPKISIIHNDWIAANLLKTKKGWFSIDNELLSISLTGFDLGGKPLYSLCKTDKRRKTYLNAYNKVTSIQFYKKHKDFYELSYLIRGLYSRLMNKTQSPDRFYEGLRSMIK